VFVYQYIVYVNCEAFEKDLIFFRRWPNHVEWRAVCI